MYISVIYQSLTTLLPVDSAVISLGCQCEFQTELALNSKCVPKCVPIFEILYIRYNIIKTML